MFNNPNNPDNKDIIGEANSMEFEKALKNLASYQQRSNELEPFKAQSRWRNTRLVPINFKVKRTFGIVPGKYKLKEIFDKLQSKTRSIGEGLDQTIVTYDKELDRVVIQQNRKKLLISSYTKNSILPMLGFTNKIKTNIDTYILKNTITNNDGTTFVSPDIRAHVENQNYTVIDYIIIYPNDQYESSMPPPQTSAFKRNFCIF